MLQAVEAERKEGVSLLIVRAAEGEAVLLKEEVAAIAAFPSGLGFGSLWFPLGLQAVFHFYPIEDLCMAWEMSLRSRGSTRTR